MQKKGANGRYTDEFRDHVVAWVVGEVGRTPGEAAHRFDVNPKTTARWMRQAGATVRLPETSSPESGGGGGQRSRPRTSGKARAPVEDLAKPDRDRAVNAVRQIAEIVELTTGRMLDKVRKAKGVPAVSKDTAQAMLHLSRTSGLLIDTHPGLMKLAGIEEKAERGKRDLGKVMAALGVESDTG